MKSFIYNRVQGGYWGRTVLKTVTVRAKTREDADIKVCARKDNGKRLRNGDRITYDFNCVED